MASRTLVLVGCALGLVTACGEPELDTWCDHIWQVRADCGGCGEPDRAEFVEECVGAMLRAEMTDGTAREAFQCAGQATTCDDIRSCLAPTRLSISSDGIAVHRSR